MADFVEMEVGNQVLLVESDAGDLAVPAGRLRDLATVAAQDFEMAMTSVREVSEAAIRRVTSGAMVPDEITLEFAIQLASEAGVVVARTSATANMKVNLKWKIRKDGSGGEREVVHSEDLERGE